MIAVAAHEILKRWLHGQPGRGKAYVTLWDGLYTVGLAHYAVEVLKHCPPSSKHPVNSSNSSSSA